MHARRATHAHWALIPGAALDANLDIVSVHQPQQWETPWEVLEYVRASPFGQQAAVFTGSSAVGNIAALAKIQALKLIDVTKCDRVTDRRAFTANVVYRSLLHDSAAPASDATRAHGDCTQLCERMTGGTHHQL